MVTLSSARRICAVGVLHHAIPILQTAFNTWLAPVHTLSLSGTAFLPLA